MSDPVSANPAPMAVPPQSGEGLITVNYDGTGLEWVDLWDNTVLCWVIDANAKEQAAEPRILGTFPPAAPETSPIISPSWASVAVSGIVYVPDTWRGRLEDFFTWLATNNGAQRKVIGKGISAQKIRETYRIWASNHPDLALADYPDQPATEAETRRRAQLGPLE
jgi:hypothetical protein